MSNFDTHEDEDCRRETGQSYADAYQEAMDDVMSDDRIFKAEIMERLIEDAHLDTLLQLVICCPERHLLAYAQRLRDFGIGKIRDYCERKAEGK